MGGSSASAQAAIPPRSWFLERPAGTVPVGVCVPAGDSAGGGLCAGGGQCRVAAVTMIAKHAQGLSRTCSVVPLS
jgi:hypothetical protein